MGVTQDAARVGEVIGPVEVTRVAHGGHCVARHEGRVIFVRHTAPGERVSVRLTDTSRDAFWRGDAVVVHRAAEGRVEPQCRIAGPGGCGGCDFQHLDGATQRGLKQQVLAEQLRRLAGFEWDGQVVPVQPTFEWRTRLRYWQGPQGPAMRQHHSHELVPLPEEGCRIAAMGVPANDAIAEGAQVRLVQSGRSVLTLVDGAVTSGRGVVTEHAAGRTWRVAAEGFWQVHPAGAETLVQAVLDLAQPRVEERAFDLYCGVGLFAGALVDHGLKVWGVESDAKAIKHANANVPDAQFVHGPVERMLKRLPRRADLVVLDPPRRGAGRAVMKAVLERSPRAIVYVACDPSALGRDVGIARDHGWQIDQVRAFDLFPQTHHMEAVALLTRPAGR